MTEGDTRTTVHELYDAYEQREFNRVAALLNENIDWIIYAPVTIFPFAGPRRGRAAVLQAMREIAEAYAIESYDREIVVVEGDRAAIVSDVSMRQRATGRLLRFRVANFLRIENGRLAQFREFVNSFDVVEQALGRELTV